MKESMLGTGPQACLAPLPCTLFKTSNVVLGHGRLRCDRQALKRHTMVRSMPIGTAAKIRARSVIR